MKTTRRSFLMSALGGAVAAAVPAGMVLLPSGLLVPEEPRRRVWQVGAKLEATDDIGVDIETFIRSKQLTEPKMNLNLGGTETGRNYRTPGMQSLELGPGMPEDDFHRLCGNEPIPGQPGCYRRPDGSTYSLLDINRQWAQMPVLGLSGIMLSLLALAAGDENA